MANLQIAERVRRRIALAVGRVPSRSPDFFIAGATRAGSTYLYHLVADHPDIFMPAVKEPSYFNHDGRYTPDLKRYRDYFYGYGGQALIGEATPLYWNVGTFYDAGGVLRFGRPGSPMERIKQARPDAKIIITLRDPMTRIASLHGKAFGQGKLTTSLDEEIEAELAGGSREHLIHQNRYDIHLSSLLELFPREAVHVLIFEEWTKKPEETRAELLNFLGAAPFDGPLPKSEAQVNARERYQRRPGGDIGERGRMSSTIEVIVRERLAPVKPYLTGLLGRWPDWAL